MTRDTAAPICESGRAALAARYHLPQRDQRGVGFSLTFTDAAHRGWIKSPLADTVPSSFADRLSLAPVKQLRGGAGPGHGRLSGSFLGRPCFLAEPERRAPIA